MIPGPKLIQFWNQKVMTDDDEPYTYELTTPRGFKRGVLRILADSEVGTASLDIKLRAYNTTEGAWYDIAGASLAQITANQTTTIDLVIGPGLTAVANRVVSQPLPRRIQVYAAVGDATTEGFTVNGEFEFFP